MRNRMVSCKEIVYMSSIGVVFFILFSILITKYTWANFILNLIELTIFLVLVVYFYCKKKKN
jgi:cbb3-type cytochrome oxidase subunit 3